MIDQCKGVEELFGQALGLEAGERNAFLDAACDGRPALRKRLERLLEAYPQARSFLETSALAGDATALQQAPAKIGSRIGNYRLLELIGEGGMGLVYMAEQLQPVRRLVALKIIKPGLDSRQVIARFEAERQALAMMDHPNIARVLEAGTNESGHPYFVMELVRGIPITEICDQKRLNVRERLALFIQVCQAVQHAHQKGIIHRDIKPTNVLVTMHDAVAVPKIIDFGIAKALGQSLTEHTLHTGFAQLIGTPLYMSPEQAEMNQFGVDTRSDVYSLGVMLYELLAGTTPFDKETLKSAGFDEMRRIIREVEPTRPSARVSTLAADTRSTVSARRNSDPRRISLTLHGELDWIVMRALEKDRNRRYDSPSDLAADIQRYLADEPVQAGPPTAAYRLQKFVRRHRSRFVMGGLVSGLVLLVTVGAVVSYVRAKTNQLQIAGHVENSLAGARAAIESSNLPLAAQHLAEANGRLGDLRPQLTSVATKVDHLAAELTARRDDQTRLEKFQNLAREFQDFMGNYAGDGERDERLAQEALGQYAILTDAGWRKRLDASHLSPDQKQQVLDTAYETLVNLADYRYRWSRKHEDRQVLQVTLNLLQLARSFHEPTRAFWFVRREVHRQLKDEHAAHEDDRLFREAPAKTAWDYYLPGHVAGWQGDTDEAIRAYEAALRVQPDNYSALYFLGFRLASANRHAEAIGFLSACIAMRPERLHVYGNRAGCYFKLNRLTEAEADLTAAIAAARTEGQRRTALQRRMQFYQDAGWDEKAHQEIDAYIRLLEQDWQKSQTEFGATAEQTLGRASVVAEWFLANGRLDEGLSLYESTVKSASGALGADHQMTIGIILRWTHSLNENVKDRSAAEAILRGLLGQLSADHLSRPNVLAALGSLLVEEQEYDEAEVVLRECLSREQYPPRDGIPWQSFHRRSLLGGVLVSRSRRLRTTDPTAAAVKLVEAEPLLRVGHEGLQARSRVLPRKSLLVEAQLRLVHLYREQGETEEAEHWQNRVTAPADDARESNRVAWMLATDPDQTPWHAVRVVQLAQQATDLRPEQGRYWNTLALAQYRAGDWKAAMESAEKSRQFQTERLPHHAYDWFILAMAHCQLGNPSEARQWYDRAVECMEKKHPRNHELRAFQTEAAELIGAEHESKLREKKRGNLN